MFDPRRLNENASVAPQIAPEDLPAIKVAGFATVVNNRPDGEEPDQPHGDAIRAAAEAIGLRYLSIPVGAAPLTTETVAAMAEALEHGPVLAFCRSGTRSCNLWAMAQASRGGDPDGLVHQGRIAGYGLDGLRSILAQLALAAGRPA